MGFFMLKWTVCSQERMLQLDMHSKMIHLALRAEDAVETAILSSVTFSLQWVYFPSAPPLSPSKKIVIVRSGFEVSLELHWNVCPS